jgi:hypothetical protein
MARALASQLPRVKQLPAQTHKHDDDDDDVHGSVDRTSFHMHSIVGNLLALLSLVLR